MVMMEFAALYFNAMIRYICILMETPSMWSINSRVRDTTNWIYRWKVMQKYNLKFWVNRFEETEIQPPNFSYGVNKASTKVVLVLLLGLSKL